jgi:hypothetical protein
MNKRLEHALAELTRLPEDEQEVIAALILQEIAAERAWDERFERTGSKLADLARRAREQYQLGETSALEFPSKE